jgi:hypothetical protein
VKTSRNRLLEKSRHCGVKLGGGIASELFEIALAIKGRLVRSWDALHGGQGKRSLIARATPSGVFAYQMRDATVFAYLRTTRAVTVKAKYPSLLNHKMALVANRAGAVRASPPVSLSPMWFTKIGGASVIAMTAKCRCLGTPACDEAQHKDGFLTVA